MQRLAADTRSRLAPRRRYRGLALAVALTAAVVVALSAVGAVGYAATASTRFVQAVGSLTQTHHTQRIEHHSPADDQYGEKQHCNSGRGNWSETSNGSRSHDSTTLIDPHNGGSGPGNTPTDDCDPGNSGPHNHGGD
jgi:hypothetical protein